LSWEKIVREPVILSQTPSVIRARDSDPISTHMCVSRGRSNHCRNTLLDNIA
jgi:hypothetical protein